MKKTLLSLVGTIFAAVAAPCGAAAFQVSGLPADSVAKMTLSSHTADEIKTERLKQDMKIITTGSDALGGTESHQDSVRKLVDLFFYDQYHHFQDPLAPYFMLMSKDAKLALGIGGAIRMRGWYDFAGSIPSRGFAPYLIPIPEDAGHRRKLDGTPGGSSLFLRIIGRNRVLGDIVGYIQTEFSATDNTLKLKKAYVTISDWTVGYTSTAFNDPAAEAPTIDGAGQSGKAGRSAMQVRWDHNFRAPWGIGAGVALPKSQVDANNVTTQTINDWFPDLAAYVAYRLPHDGHLRLAGTMRVLPYRNLLTGKNVSKVGWGVQLSAIIYPIPRLAVYAEANTGQGYSTYMGDLSIGQHDLINNPEKPGSMYAPWAMGINIGCKYNFRPNVYACMALAEARNFDRYGTSPDEYKYGLYGSWSLFWEPTPRMQVGAEYLHGRRNNVDHSHGSANRVDLLFQFSF